MGLDSAYGIGSLKPGVCTSSTRPASPFEGQVIYETDTDLIKAYNGTSWVSQVDATSTQTLTNKTITNPVITSTPSTGTAQFALDGTSAVLTITNDGTATPFGATNVFSGMVLMTNQTTGVTAAFLVGGATLLLIGQSNGSTEFTVTSGSASKSNFYWSGSAVTLQNKTGSSSNYCIMAFRTRVGL